MINVLKSKKYHASRIVGKYRADSGASSVVYPTRNSKALQYMTPTLARVRFLEALGILWDSPVYKHKPSDGRENVNYSVTVTKLVSWVDFTNETLAALRDEQEELYRFNGKFNPFTLEGKREVIAYFKDNPEYLPASNIAILWALENFGDVYFDIHEANWLACPITGKLFAYDIINIDALVYQYGDLK